MKRPWLSVIMPTFNGAGFLGHALESVARQDDGTIEVIAVDDGSTDATPATLAAYAAAADDRDRTAALGNWVESTVLGMSAARGEYVCWLHQDDSWRPRRLAALRGLAVDHPDAAFIVHPSWYIDASGRRIGCWHCPLSILFNAVATFSHGQAWTTVWASIVVVTGLSLAFLTRPARIPSPVLRPVEIGKSRNAAKESPPMERSPAEKRDGTLDRIVQLASNRRSTVGIRQLAIGGGPPSLSPLVSGTAPEGIVRHMEKLRTCLQEAKKEAEGGCQEAGCHTPVP
ncbi:MAG TPA: glycosyltransferase family A protein [Pirellulales bacterium]|nr:glycosyltransferase family A protein [Pirellulales bacterium]